MASPRSSRVALVLGASSGIGLATAQRLSADGWVVALLARHRGSLEHAARTCPGETLVVPADLGDEAQVQSAVRDVLAAHGRIDAVVASAQPMAYGSVEQVPSEIFETIVDVAVNGMARLARAVLPVFRAQGGGTLVVVNSLLGEVAVPSMSSYVTAKWGQLGLVRSLQLEVRGERGVHVCLVSPGAIDTPIYTQAASYAGRRGAAPPPVIKPEKVAAAVVRCLDRPRRHVEVGPVNRLAVLGFRLFPAIYDRLAPTLVRHGILRGPVSEPDPGNVLAPHPAGEALHGGWTLGGRLRSGPGRRARWFW